MEKFGLESKQEPFDKEPMHPKERGHLLVDVPDIESLQDLRPKDRLPSRIYSRNLSQGERFWVTGSSNFSQTALTDLQPERLSGAGDFSSGTQGWLL